MERRENETKAAIGYEIGREVYEGSVMHRMYGRSGAHTPTGASGIAHEVMAMDKKNFQHMVKMDKCHTQLTKTPNAPQVDAVTMNTITKKVVERLQYKDTPSNSGIQKTLKQVESGKYQQTQLIGTAETTERFNELAAKNGISKRMHSSGISGNDTKRIGNKFTGQTPKLAHIGNAAKKSAVTAVGVTAGIEVVKSIVNGDSIAECAGHVTSKSAESAVVAVASAVAAEATYGVAASLFAASVIPVAGPMLVAGTIAVATGVITGKVTDGIFDGLGDRVEDIVDDIGDAISDLCSDIGDFFRYLF